MRSFYRIHDFCFMLSTNCNNAGVLLERLFPSLQTVSTEYSAEWHFQRDADHSGIPLYTIYADGKAALQSETLNKALDHLEWSITTRILHAHRHFLQIHAAALVADEGALIIVGPSGSGKSSLALSLLLQGWKCLSDEIVFIDPSSCRIFSFPRNFHLSHETLRHFPTLDMGDDLIAFTDASGKSRIDPALITGEWTTISAQPWCLVFPAHGPDYLTALTPLGETPSLMLLSAQALNLGEFGMKGLEALAHFAGKCDSYMLTSSDLSSASSILSHLMKNSRKNKKPTCKYYDHHLHTLDGTKEVTMTIGI